jgi:DNA-binding CsgD family transcriptional regulator
MYGNRDESESATDEWRPEGTEEYATGPVLTDRQAETIAALDAHSRQSTAAILGIEPSTVDRHRQDGQARAVAAVRQLQYLLTESKTIREAVENAVGTTTMLADTDRTTFRGEKTTGDPLRLPEGTTLTLGTDENGNYRSKINTSSVNPRLLDTPVMEQDLEDFDPAPHQQFVSPQRSSSPSRSEVVEFVKESDDATAIEVLNPTTGDEIDELDVLQSFSLEVDLQEWELVEVGELIYEQVAEADPDRPLLFHRVQEDQQD